MSATLDQNGFQHDGAKAMQKCCLRRNLEFHRLNSRIPIARVQLGATMVPATSLSEYDGHWSSVIQEGKSWDNVARTWNNCITRCR